MKQKIFLIIIILFSITIFAQDKPPAFKDGEWLKFKMSYSGFLKAGNSTLSLAEKDLNGKKIFHEHFKSPTKSTFMKIVSGAIAISSVALASSAAYSAGANRSSMGRYNSHGAQMNTYAKGFSELGSASFSAMSKRFKASANTKNDKFILTKLSSGVGLVKLDKDSGKKVKEILLKDKKPIYKIDDVERVLYYQANKNTLYAYKI